MSPSETVRPEIRLEMIRERIKHSHPDLAEQLLDVIGEVRVIQEQLA